MASDPIISIIIPVYNADAYLRECIDSVLIQSFKEYELIIVDDGSTDNSRNIVEQYQVLDHRVRYVRQIKSNAGVARNTGMRMARGEYLIFLDGDDFFEPDMLESLLGAISAGNADVAVCDAFIFDVNEDRKKAGMVRRLCVCDENPIRIKHHAGIVFQMTNPAPWNKLFRTEFIQNSHLEFQSLQKANDLSFVETAIAYADEVAFIDKPLINYRVNNEGSITGQKRVASTSFIEALIELRLRLESKGILGLFGVSYAFLVIDHFLYHLNTNTEKDARESIQEEIKCGILETLGVFPICVEKSSYLCFEDVRYLDFALDAYYRLIGMSVWEMGSERKGQVQNTIDFLRGIIKKGYQSLLHKFPLGDPGLNIGIYGTGSHTTNLILAYNNLVGEIKASIVLIDSYKSGGTHCGYPIKLLDHADDLFDHVIVSGFAQAEEMENSLKDKMGAYISVINPYRHYSRNLFCDDSFFNNIK